MSYKKSLSRRFALNATLVLTLILALSSLFIFQQYSKLFKDHQHREQAMLVSAAENKGMLLTNLVSKISPEAVLGLDLYALKLYATEVLRDKEVTSVEIYDKNGNALLREQKSQLLEDSRFFEQEIRTDPEKMGVNLLAGRVKIGHSTRELKKAEKEAATRQALVTRRLIIAVIVLTIMVNVLISLVLTFVLRRTVISPIADISKRMSAVAQGDYAHSVAIDTDDEIGALAQSFEVMRITIRTYIDNLEQIVKDRTKQLRDTQKELLEKAHRAGMADVATGTIHNVGNILNSITATLHSITQMQASSPIADYTKGVSLLKQNMENLTQFMQTGSKGPALMQYFLKLDEAFNKYENELKKDTHRLEDKVQNIADVIAAQQNYASSTAFIQEVDIHNVVKDALIMQSASMEKYHINIIKNYKPIPKLFLQKTKLIHVLINLFKNAREALLDISENERAITISSSFDDNILVLTVSDNGTGISADNLSNIFKHGFTTKPKGHGFGLHSSANYLTEMGGKLSVESSGLGQGATFIIELPLNREEVNGYG